MPYTTKPRILLGQKAPLEGNEVAYNFGGYESFAHVYRWEYNYSGNGNDWHTISGAEGRDFQPWECWQTVYYRRVTLEEHKNIWGQPYHEAYATSNAVKITPSSPPPTPTQSTYSYYACANVAGTFTINFTPGEAATSSMWSLPADTWRVNGGQGVNYQYSYYVGAATSVTISVPANVRPGTYEIHASSNGPAGSAGYRSIPLVVVDNQTATPTIVGPRSVAYGSISSFSLTDLSSPGGSNFSWIMPPGWTITRGQGTRAVDVRSPSANSVGYLQVNFTNQCGLAANAGILVYNDRSTMRIACTDCNQSTALAKVYPNPVSDVLTVTPGQPGAFTVTVRNAQGIVVETLRGKDALKHQTDKWTPGLYYLEITDAAGVITKQRLSK